MNTSIKSILNLTWKVGLGLIGLTAFAIGIFVCDVWYTETRGRDYHNDSTLSKDVVVEAYNNNLVRVKNKQTGQYTTRKIRWVSGTPERDTLTVFCDKDGKRGFLNVKNGEIVIPAQYSKAWQFSEGLAAVLGDDNKIGFINSDNQLVINYSIPFEKGFDYIFKDGFCVVKNWTINRYSYAVYSKDGQQVLPWGYTRVDEPNGQGYRVVASEIGAELYDCHFQKVLPETYDNLELARGNEGVYATKNHVKSFMALDGTVIEPFVVDCTYQLKYLSKYNEDDVDEYELVPDILVYQVDGWNGLMDAQTGQIFTPAIYWSIDMASKDLIMAKLSQNDQGVIIDHRGRIANH